MTLVRLIQGMQRLARDHKKRVFRLKEISAFAGESRASTAMTLLRAAKKGLVARAGTLWINLMDPPDLLEIALAAVSPSYCSFESALYEQGLLSQSPRGALTMATTRRPRLLRTPIGMIHYVHIKPALFFGFDQRRMARAEKAWLDLLYIRGLRGRRSLISEELSLEKLARALTKKMARRYPAWVGSLARNLQTA